MMFRFFLLSTALSFSAAGCASRQAPATHPRPAPVVVIPKVGAPSPSPPSLYQHVPLYDRYSKLEPLILEYLWLTERQRELDGIAPPARLSRPLANQRCEDMRNELMLMAVEDSILRIETLLVSSQSGIKILRSLSGEPIEPKDISDQLEVYRSEIERLRRSAERMKAKKLAVFACLLRPTMPRHIP